MCWYTIGVKDCERNLVDVIQIHKFQKLRFHRTYGWVAGTTIALHLQTGLHIVCHHLSRVAVLFEVVEDLGDRHHTGIFRAGIAITAGIFLVPIEDPADKGRDQGHIGFCAGRSLGETEQQGQIAMNAFAFQLLSGLNALPGGGDLDQHLWWNHGL